MVKASFNLVLRERTNPKLDGVSIPGGTRGVITSINRNNTYEVDLYTIDFINGPRGVHLPWCDFEVYKPSPLEELASAAE